MAPRKKAKTAQNAVCVAQPAPQASSSTVRRTLRGRRGGLRDMPNMPLDILLEIFGHMHPRDLLTLARTSKSFREFLMRKTAQTLWKASLERVDGLPTCPPYMSEPAYTNLLFSSHCHNCLKSNVQTVFFPLSARYCPACRPLMLVDRVHHYTALKFLSSLNLDVAIYDLFPSVNEGSHERWSRAAVPEFRRRLELLEDPTEKMELIAEQIERTNMIKEATAAYDLWKQAQKSTRAEELDQIRADRVSDIQRRLRQEGWGEELDKMEDVEKCTLACQSFAAKAEPLTDRKWLTIKARAFLFMEGVKTRRLEAERKAVLGSHFESFSKAYRKYRPLSIKRTRDSDLEPSLTDFLAMPEFQAILDVEESADLNVLDDEDEMRIKFDAAATRWREERKAEFTTMIRDTLKTQVPEGVDPLTLAIAVFSCDFCKHEGLRYPEVVAHTCNRSCPLYLPPPNLYTQYSPYSLAPSLYLSAVKSYSALHFKLSIWTHNLLRVSLETVACMRDILSACGLDADTATRADMDACQASLICTEPDGDIFQTIFDKKSAPAFEVYNCRTALQHSTRRSNFSRHFGFHTWTRISPEEEKEVLKAEKNEPTKLNSKMHKYGCAYCVYAARPFNLVVHLRHKHDITVDDTELHDHCYLHHDAEPEEGGSIVLRRDVKGKFSVERRPLSTFWGFDISDMFPAFHELIGGYWDSDSDEYPDVAVFP